MTLAGDMVGENLNNEAIGVFATFDPDTNDHHTYTLIHNPGDRFTIVGNTLLTSANASLNYEKTQSWNITVRSYDNGTHPLPMYIDRHFVIFVRDVNEAPNFVGISGSTVCFFWNWSIGTQIRLQRRNNGVLWSGKEREREDLGESWEMGDQICDGNS